MSFWERRPTKRPWDTPSPKYQLASTTPTGLFVRIAGGRGEDTLRSRPQCRREAENKPPHEQVLPVPGPAAPQRWAARGQRVPGEGARRRSNGRCQRVRGVEGSRTDELGHTQWAERPGHTSRLCAPGRPGEGEARAPRAPPAAARPGLPRPGAALPPAPPPGLTLPGKGPGRISFSACLFSSTRRALQFSHQTPRSEPGEEPPPLPEPGEPVPKPGEPPREPGELVPMPGEAGPGEPVKELGDEVPEPGDGVPDEPSAEPAPSGVGRLPARDSSYAFRYQLSGEKGAAGLVGEHTSFTCGETCSQGPQAGETRAPEGRAERQGARVRDRWELGGRICLHLPR